MLQNFLIPSILAGQQLQQQEHFSNKISSVAGKITHISYCASKNKGVMNVKYDKSMPMC